MGQTSLMLASEEQPEQARAPSCEENAACADTLPHVPSPHTCISNGFYESPFIVRGWRSKGVQGLGQGHMAKG